MQFVPRPNLPEGLAALVAQLQARQGPSIASGITSAVNSITGGLGDRFDAKAKSDAQMKSLMASLIEQGVVSPTSTADIPGILSGKTSLPVTKAKTKGDEDILNDQEVGLMSAALKLKPEQLKGVRRDVAKSLFPQHFLDTNTGKTVQAPKGTKALPSAATGTNRPPPGYRFKPDGDLEPIPGGKPAIEAKEKEEFAAKTDASVSEKARMQMENINSALKNVSKWSTGWGAATVGKLPGSQAKDLAADVKTIKAILTFDEIQDMRSRGVRLGVLSDADMALLGSTVTALDLDQSRPQLVAKLNKLKELYDKSGIGKSASGGGAPAKPAAPAFTPEMAARKAELEAKIAAKRAPK